MPEKKISRYAPSLCKPGPTGRIRFRAGTPASFVLSGSVVLILWTITAVLLHEHGPLASIWSPGTPPPGHASKARGSPRQGAGLSGASAPICSSAKFGRQMLQAASTGRSSVTSPGPRASAAWLAITSVGLDVGRSTFSDLRLSHAASVHRVDLESLTGSRRSNPLQSSPLGRSFHRQGKPGGRPMTRSAFDPHLPLMLLYDDLDDG